MHLCTVTIVRANGHTTVLEVDTDDRFLLDIRDAATGIPLINMRPSFARPPFAVKNVMNGSVNAPREVLSVVMPGIAASSAP